MNDLECAIVNNVLFNYYQKHKKLPTCGHSLVATNVIISGDMLDIKNNSIYIKYNYYKKATVENKFITSTMKLCKR